ncbi:MAG: ATP synthase subunit I [Balneolaceae bacterium]
MGNISEASDKKIRLSVCIVFVLFLIHIILLPSEYKTGVAAGYFLGLFSVFAHFIFFRSSKKYEDQSFARYYYIGLFIRFLLVCLIFLLLLIFTKINEIGFTLSFIISYLFHSVMEIIFINKQLTVKKENR